MSELDYPWVGDIVDFLASRQKLIKDRVDVFSGQYFWVDKLTCVYWERVAKYACFFPQRTIISAGAMKVDATGSSYIDPVVLYNYFFGRAILCNDIAELSPTYQMNENNCKVASAVTHRFDNVQENDSRLALLNKCGTARMNSELIKHMYISMPWIYQARLEDYFEIIEKYKTEFANYNKYIATVAKVATGEIELTRTVSAEIRDSIIDIQIALEKKQSELKAKGIVTVVGLCMTAIPHLLPDIAHFIDPALLATILGGGTLMECMKLINDYNSSKHEKIDNPFWVMWKWSTTVTK